MIGQALIYAGIGLAAAAFIAANMQDKGLDFYKAVMAIDVHEFSEEKINEAAEKA